MKHQSDFDGDGFAEIPVSSPWGIGLLKQTGNTLTAPMMAPNGTRFGEWLLNTHDNNFTKLGDFDGDGKTELLVTSPWGIGILKQSGNTLSAPMMAPNGTRFGGWLFNSVDNQICAIGDFDGDGKAEILVTSGWGIGILKLSGNTLSAPMMAPNGTRFGGWLFNSADNQIRAVGDFDGDGKDEILITSGWGIGILKLSGNTLSAPMMAPNGTRFGGWLFNSLDNRIPVVGDFDGDGKAEILITSGWGIGILKLSSGVLQSPVMAENGKKFGNWRLNTTDNRFGLSGDFDGDGKTELFVASPWGIGILKLSGNTFTAPVMVSNGTSINGWRINTEDNRFNKAADFDKDGRTEILVTSPWGLGILNLSGNSLVTSMMAPNGTRFGGWLLNTADNDMELGVGESNAVIIYHKDWNAAVLNTKNTLQQRGYMIHSTDDANIGLTKLRVLSLTAKSGDNVIVYLAGHGGNARQLGDMSKTPSLKHNIQFNKGELLLSQLSPLFQNMGNMGADLTVIDGSCSGGETAYNAIGERYCAVATTSLYTPGLTNFPDFSNIIKKEGKPSAFALWWAKPRLAASWANGVIISSIPLRFSQRLYRNDRTEFSKLMFFIRPAVNVLATLDSGGWYLKYSYCYLYRFIYADEYNKLTDTEKKKFTNNTESFISRIQSAVSPQETFVDKLISTLDNDNLMANSANVYVSYFSTCWQTLAGDYSWNPETEPNKYTDKLHGISTSPYQGKIGFDYMRKEMITHILIIRECYQKQKDILWEIDGLVSSRRMFNIAELRSTSLTIPRADSMENYMDYNETELRATKKINKVLQDLNKSQPDLENIISLSHTEIMQLGNIKITNLVKNSMDKIKVNFLDIGATSSSLDDLIARFKALSTLQSWHLGRANFLLSLIEDAVCKVQTKQANPGEVNIY